MKKLKKIRLKAWAVLDEETGLLNGTPSLENGGDTTHLHIYTGKKNDLLFNEGYRAVRVEIRMMASRKRAKGRV